MLGHLGSAALITQIKSARMRLNISRRAMENGLFAHFAANVAINLLSFVGPLHIQINQGCAAQTFESRFLFHILLLLAPSEPALLLFVLLFGLLAVFVRKQRRWLFKARPRISIVWLRLHCLFDWRWLWFCNSFNLRLWLWLCLNLWSRSRLRLRLWLRLWS